MNKEYSDFLAGNLKQLRKVHDPKLTQQNAADLFEIKKATYAAYEENRSIPPYTTIRKIADFYDLTIDILVGKDLSQSTSTKFLDIGNQRLLFPISVDEDDRELVDVVPIKASAGYLDGFSDPSYIQELPKVRFPFHNIIGTARFFQIKGDSMLPIQPESYILTEFVNDPLSMKDNDCYILITQEEGIIYKRIKNHIKINGTITLVSDNKEYDPYELHMGNIKEVWKAKGFMSFNLPFPKNETNHELMDEILKMKKDIEQLKKHH